MKTRFILPLFFLGLASWVPKDVPKSGSEVVGDYCEARTASVFAGACHYNGELVTSGRDAILAWNVSQGIWKGVNLTGIRMLAILSSEQNLGDATAARKCELIIDSTATDAQASAVADWLQFADGNQLGEIKSVRRSAILFNHKSSDYIIAADGIAAMTVHPMPNGECCTQPHMVWYSPMMQLDHRMVGFTESAQCIASAVGDPWDRSDENSAFYGTFTSSKVTQVGVVSADR